MSDEVDRLQVVACDPQPRIPMTVLDLQVEIEHHPKGYAVVSLHSAGDGVRQWADERRKWGMPEELIVGAQPDQVEFYREVFPHWSPGATVEIRHGLDGIWYWLVWHAEPVDAENEP